MSEFLTWAFVVLCGGFFFGLTVYVFYLGLKPGKRNQPDTTEVEIHFNKHKTRLS